MSTFATTKRPQADKQPSKGTSNAPKEGERRGDTKLFAHAGPVFPLQMSPAGGGYEGWHVVQQRQGRVRPDGRAKGLPVNSDPGLEREADTYGAQAGRGTEPIQRVADGTSTQFSSVIQMAKVKLTGGEKEEEKEILELSEKEMDELMLAQPMLTDEMEKELDQWIIKKNLSSVRTKYFTGLLAKWKSGEGEPSKKKKGKKKKQKVESGSIAVYSDEDSDLSDGDYDFDHLHKRKKMSTTSTINRSHVPTLEDKIKGASITSMHHSDTFLIAMQGGQFVPRTIKGKPNKEAHRKRLPEKLLVEKAERRDNEKLTEKERETAKEELISAQKQIQFGSSIDWEEGEYDKELLNKQEALRSDLKKEESAVGDLMRRSAVHGVRSGTKDHTHKDAEQKLLNSVVWRGMRERLMKGIGAVKQDPINQLFLSELGIRLLLNRSSCLGCGKVLALELIDFWQAVAKLIRFNTWREAKDAYAHLNLFTIAFPVIYEYDKEKQMGFKNFLIILEGLRDAGWRVEAPKGIESNKHAEENHKKLTGLLAEQSSKDGKKEKIDPKRVMMDVEDPHTLLSERFNIGEASGEGNQCLLNTAYQLVNNTQVENKEAVNAMRDTLVQAGLAIGQQMIDIYGGAGMQLANDLNIRIQVIQVEGNNIVTHPVLGNHGRLVFILHQNAHFSPLWPKGQ